MYTCGIEGSPMRDWIDLNIRHDSHVQDKIAHLAIELVEASSVLLEQGLSAHT